MDRLNPAPLPCHTSGAAPCPLGCPHSSPCSELSARRLDSRTGVPQPPHPGEMLEVLALLGTVNGLLLGVIKTELKINSFLQRATVVAELCAAAQVPGLVPRSSCVGAKCHQGADGIALGVSKGHGCIPGDVTSHHHVPCGRGAALPMTWARPTPRLPTLS